MKLKICLIIVLFAVIAFLIYYWYTRYMHFSTVQKIKNKYDQQLQNEKNTTKLSEFDEQIIQKTMSNTYTEVKSHQKNDKYYMSKSNDSIILSNDEDIPVFVTNVDQETIPLFNSTVVFTSHDSNDFNFLNEFTNHFISADTIHPNSATIEILDDSEILEDIINVQPSIDQPPADQTSNEQPSDEQPSGDQPSNDQPSDDQPLDTTEQKSIKEESVTQEPGSSYDINDLRKKTISEIREIANDLNIQINNVSTNGKNTMRKKDELINSIINLKKNV